MADNLSPAAPLSAPPELLAACPKFRILVLGSPESTKQELFCQVFGTDLGKKSVGDAFSLGHEIEQELDLHDQNSRLAIHTSFNFVTDDASHYDRTCDFLRARSAPSTDPADRIHSVWYCVASEEDRPVAELEKRFFTSGLPLAAPNVPVIIVFTKYDEFVNQVRIDWSRDAQQRGLSKLPVAHILRDLSSEKFDQQIGAKWDRVLSQTVPRVCVSSGDGEDDARSVEELAERTLAGLRDRSVKYAFAAAQRNSALISTQFSANIAADYFEVDTGHARKLPGVDMRYILPNFFAKAVALFNLHDDPALLDATATLLPQILNATFDPSQQPLLAECLTQSSTDPRTILANLSPHERAVLLTQALAAPLLFLHRLAATQWPHGDGHAAAHTLTARAVARVLDEIRAGAERRAVLQTVEASPLFTTCTLRSAIADLLVAAVGRGVKGGGAAVAATAAAAGRLQTGGSRGYVEDDHAQVPLTFAAERGPDDVVLPCGLTILPLT
ncbi:hypothetical protein BT67DRAFT_464267 [Trichocladium antarcticum]|uniref:Uncharacterized protein n=1 Tax=Trichocladium antarcticum TaxID=1450529 RepID=A0AAN6UFD0_9PEZI|nr:hypothetical protein BT67DRAFT_464267 [Trichocladium antarcticum]